MEKIKGNLFEPDTIYNRILRDRIHAKYCRCPTCGSTNIKQYIFYNYPMSHIDGERRWCWKFVYGCKACNEKWDTGYFRQDLETQEELDAICKENEL